MAAPDDAKTRACKQQQRSGRQPRAAWNMTLQKRDQARMFNALDAARFRG
jgi:hypothetical protein